MREVPFTIVNLLNGLDYFILGFSHTADGIHLTFNSAQSAAMVFRVLNRGLSRDDCVVIIIIHADGAHVALRSHYEFNDDLISIVY